MKRNIRKGVFESNSSSCHSLSISNGYDSESKLGYNSLDKKVHVDLGEFGWGYDELTTPAEKLSYLLTMVYQTELDYSEKDDSKIKETEGFKRIEDEVIKSCGCDGIEIDDYDGYIDHQSSDILDGFLSEHGITIHDFIFKDSYVMIIDNDNH